MDSAATDQYGQVPLSSIPYPHAPCARPAQASHFPRPRHSRPLLLRPPFTRMRISAARRQAAYTSAQKLDVCVHVCTEEGGSYVGQRTVTVPQLGS